MPASGHTQFVFVYGSLVWDLADGRSGPVRAARLHDHRRAWNVAMDNAVSLPGYKYYLDARDGSRPDVLVTFLNLVAAPGNRVNGMLVPVRRDELAALDRRERNYERREVTVSIEAPPAGRVWTYFGRPEAQKRFEDGSRAGRTVVERSYLDRVRAGFAALAPEALSEFDQSTDRHGCSVMELTRIDLD
jgi:cation transport regulator ChaC